MTARFVSVSSLALLASVLIGCGGSSGSPQPPPPPPPVNNAVVDFGASQQTIRGFGGASAWIVDMNAHPAQADALFGNSGSQQIGLSILRVRIDPSSTTAGSQWDTEVGNAQAAIAAGSDVSVIATPWTPPGTWKINLPDPTKPLVMGSLDTNYYTDYANYLESFVTYMANANPPVNLYGISMQNEPDANVTYESCVWTGAQMDAWVANNSSVLTTKLIMPEAVNLTSGSLPSLADPTLNDPNAVSHVAIIGTHLYGTPPSPYANAASKGKEVWMTEHSIPDTGITGALELAKEIHDSMTVANYNAYVYWWLQNWTVNNPSPFVNGLIDDPAQDNNLTLNGYAMGQFSKFVRPGYLRSNATSNPNGAVYVSAYKGSSYEAHLHDGLVAATRDVTTGLDGMQGCWSAWD